MSHELLIRAPVSLEYYLGDFGWRILSQELAGPPGSFSLSGGSWPMAAKNRRRETTRSFGRSHCYLGLEGPTIT